MNKSRLIFVVSTLFWVNISLALSDSDFLVTDVQMVALPSENVSGWDIPSTKPYLVRACLLSRATRSKIVGHSFEVMMPNGVMREIVTDVNGCLNWDETLEGFNFFVPKPKFLKTERSITSKQGLNGQESAVVLIEPWHESRGSYYNEFVFVGDSTFGQLISPDLIVSGGTEALTDFMSPDSYEASEQASLSIEPFIVAIQGMRPNAEPTELSANFEFSPSVILERIDGRKTDLAFNKSHFKVEARLIKLSGQGPERSASALTPLIREAKSTLHGKLRLSFERFAFTPLMADESVVIAIKLSPISLEGEAIPGLQGFAGIFRIDELSRLGVRPISEITEKSLVDMDYETLAKSVQ